MALLGVTPRSVGEFESDSSALDEESVDVRLAPFEAKFLIQGVGHFSRRATREIYGTNTSSPSLTHGGRRQRFADA